MKSFGAFAIAVTTLAGVVIGASSPQLVNAQTYDQFGHEQYTTQSHHDLDRDHHDWNRDHHDWDHDHHDWDHHDWHDRDHHVAYNHVAAPTWQYFGYSGNRLEAKENRLNFAIQNAVASRSISPRQANQLLAEQSQINGLETRMRMSDGGHLTPGERARLTADMDRVSTQLRFELNQWHIAW